MEGNNEDREYIRIERGLLLNVARSVLLLKTNPGLGRVMVGMSMENLLSRFPNILDEQDDDEVEEVEKC